MLRKLVILGAALTLPFGLFVSSSTAGGPPPIDNSAATVHCQTITKGLIKIAPPLNNAGGSPATISVGGTLGGCTSNNPNITFPEGKSKFKGILTSASNGCATLAGASASTGTITLTWGTVPAVTLKTTIVTINSGSSVGGFQSFFSSNDLHGTFTLGAPEGAALSATGGFLGGDGGASSHANIVTSESVPTILADCGAVTGLKQIAIGIGNIDIQ